MNACMEREDQMAIVLSTKRRTSYFVWEGGTWYKQACSFNRVLIGGDQVEP